MDELPICKYLLGGQVFNLDPSNLTLPCVDNRTWTFTNSSLNGIPTGEAQVACTSLSIYNRIVEIQSPSMSCSNVSQVQVVTAKPYADEHDHCPMNVTLQAISESCDGWVLEGGRQLAGTLHVPQQRLSSPCWCIGISVAQQLGLWQDPYPNPSPPHRPEYTFFCLNVQEGVGQR